MYVALALALVACKKTEETPQPVGALVDGTAVVGVDVQTSIGPAPHDAVARAVNAYGAAVEAGAMQVTVAGSPVSIAFDDRGYGVVTQSTPGSSQIAGAERDAWVHATGSQW